MRDSETSIGFVQGPPGSRRERVNMPDFSFCSGIEFMIDTCLLAAKMQKISFVMAGTKSMLPGQRQLIVDVIEM